MDLERLLVDLARTVRRLRTRLSPPCGYGGCRTPRSEGIRGRCLASDCPLVPRDGRGNPIVDWDSVDRAHGRGGVP